jgi:hypothetical protein
VSASGFQNMASRESAESWQVYCNMMSVCCGFLGVQLKIRGYSKTAAALIGMAGGNYIAAVSIYHQRNQMFREEFLENFQESINTSPLRREGISIM